MAQRQHNSIVMIAITLAVVGVATSSQTVLAQVVDAETQNKQSADPVASGMTGISVTGTYRISTPWGEMRLSITQHSHTVAGVLSGYDGRIYKVTGAYEEGSAVGTVLGAATNSEFELHFDEDGGQWYFEMAPAGTMGAGAEEYLAIRVSPNANGLQGESAEIASKIEGTDRELDPRLFGVWRYQETNSSGGFSVTSQLLMKFNPDGTFLQGDARTMVSGSATGMESGRTGTVEQGYWYCRDGKLYAGVDGISFASLAEYQVQHGRLLIRYYDGSQQLWLMVR